MKKTIVSLLLLGSLGLGLCACARTPVPPEPEAQVPALIRDGNLVIQTSSEKLERSVAPEKNKRTSLTAALAKNESEDMQFTVRFDKDITNATVHLSELKNPSGETLSDVTVYRQHYIQVVGQHDDSLGAGWYPDGMIPLLDGSDGRMATDKSTVKAGENQGYWITVTSAIGQTPGEYTGTLTFSCDQYDPCEIPVTVTVWDFELPEKSSLETAFDFWYWYDFYNDQGIYYQQANEMFWDFFLKYRICGGMLPLAESTENAEAYAKEAKDYIEKHPRATNFRIPLYGVSGDLGGQTIEAITQNAQNIALYKALQAAGLCDRAYYYVFDEPSYDQRARNILACEAMKQAFPDIRNIVTTAQDIYDGVVSRMCPILNDVNRQRISEWKSLGSDIWTYLCVGPRAPYPTYHINDYLISARTVHWMMKDYGITGELHWASALTRKADQNGAYNITRDVWNDAYTRDDVAGDGFLCYPGIQGDGVIDRNMILPSLRLEAIRDGIEDYEYLTLLEQKIRKNLQDLGICDISAEDIVNNYTRLLYDATSSYSTDSELLEEVRRQIAAEILATDKTVIQRTLTVTEDGQFGYSFYIFAPADMTVSVNGRELSDTTNTVRIFTVAAPAEKSELEIVVGTTTHRLTLLPYSPIRMNTELLEQLQKNTKALSQKLEKYQPVYLQTFLPEFLLSANATADQRRGYISYLKSPVPYLAETADCEVSGDPRTGTMMTVTVPVGTIVTCQSAKEVYQQQSSKYWRYQLLFPATETGTGCAQLHLQYNGRTSAVYESYTQTRSDVCWLYDNHSSATASISKTETVKYETNTVDVTGYSRLVLRMRNVDQIYSPGVSVSILTEKGTEISLGHTSFLSGNTPVYLTLRLPKELDGAVTEIRISGTSDTTETLQLLSVSAQN